MMKEIRRRRKHKLKQHEEEVSYWQSYSDMMAALLLVFVLILTFTMFESKTSLEEEQGKLLAEKAIVEQQKSDLAIQESELEMRQEKIDEQAKKISEQEAILQSQGERLDKIIGVRSEVITALKTEFEGSNLNVAIDPATGSITFESSVLFPKNGYTLQEAGKTFLGEFLPRYFKVLLSEKFRDYVSEIIIEGHTDTTAGYEYNLELSQQRALSVVTYFLESKNTTLSEDEIAYLRNIVTANGRSFSAPIYNDDGTVNMDASRRVEFKFRLKDDEMVREMISILNEESAE